MDLANKLISLRKLKNWTQAEAAQKIDIQQSYLSKLENGHHMPSEDVIQKLCTAYKISQKTLLASPSKVSIKLITISMAFTLSLILIFSGYFALFFPDKYYTYKLDSSVSNETLIPRIQFTDDYQGERYVSKIANTGHEYQLIAERKVSRVENRWLLSTGFILFLLTGWFALALPKYIAKIR